MPAARFTRNVCMPRLTCCSMAWFALEVGVAGPTGRIRCVARISRWPGLRVASAGKVVGGDGGLRWPYVDLGGDLFADLMWVYRSETGTPR